MENMDEEKKGEGEVVLYLLSITVRYHIWSYGPVGSQCRTSLTFRGTLASDDWRSIIHAYRHFACIVWAHPTSHWYVMYDTVK